MPNSSGIGTSGRDRNNSCQTANGLPGSSSQGEDSVRRDLDLKQFASLSAARRRWVLANIDALPWLPKRRQTLET